MSNMLAGLGIHAVTLAAPGCASLAVTDEAIVDCTTCALGLPQGEFTVSHRQNEDGTTRYSVRATADQKYNCFVGGSINVLGRSVSEAVCSKKGEPARNPLPR